MKKFEGGSLYITLKKDGNKTFMIWSGQSDDHDPGAALNPYLDDLVESLQGTELYVEFDKLEYMNSLTVQPIIRFIKRLNENEIKTMVTYDRSSRWQAASFKALESFSSILPYITVSKR